MVSLIFFAINYSFVNILMRESVLTVCLRLINDIFFVVNCSFVNIFVVKNVLLQISVYLNFFITFELFNPKNEYYMPG